MSSPGPVNSIRRTAEGNMWLADAGADTEAELASRQICSLHPEVLATEELVGQAMLGELETAARAKQGEITIALLGGRGAQALHRLLGARARAGDPEGLICRLNVFTQDALAPMRPENSFSFVRDFERL